MTNKMLTCFSYVGRPREEVEDSALPWPLDDPTFLLECPEDEEA
jgi:hypothetical protein